MSVHCPHCLNTIEIDVETPPEELGCSSCGKVFLRLKSGTLAITVEGTDLPITYRESGSDSEPAQACDVRRRLGKYEILYEIARGGMGIVYKARQEAPRRLVALKTIKAGESANTADIKRFRFEAEAAAKLDHPNIVPVYEVGESDGLHFFSMGYVEGMSLKEAIREKPLPPRESAVLLRQIAEAIQYAHDRGIIHRDLKPANVLLDREKRPRVTDFGLAKSREADSEITKTGQVMGTPSFMPPEQARGDHPNIGAHSDIYSLGALLYALLTGRPPFHSANPVETLKQVLEREPPPVRQLNPSVPRDLETICLKCLRKEPTARYASARDLADDLMRWLENKAIVARRVSPAERAWLWCKRRPTVAGSIAAIVFAALVLTGIAVQQRLANAQRIADAQITNDRQRARSHVENALNAPADALPFSIQLLEPLEEYARPILRERFADPNTTDSQRLHAAIVLAHFGEAPIEDLVSAIPTASPRECPNIIGALRRSDSASEVVREHAIRVESEPSPDWNHKARLAVVALHLGHPSIAKDMCRARPDPIQRTILIDTLAKWHGDLLELADIVERDHEDRFRACLCLGVGQIPVVDLAPSVPSAWQTVLTRLYQTSPDAFTHSAAGWTLRQWKLDEPTLPASKEPPQGQHWHINGAGMTMLVVPPGTYRRTDLDNDGNREDGQTVVLTRPFLLADRETSVAEFQRFLDDPKYPQEKKPKEWSGVRADWSPTPDHPVQNLSWEEAVLFCNWLSWSEGFVACYRYEAMQWNFDPKANGYRLPTEAEHEYAGRSGTTTTYPCGELDAMVPKFAVFFKRRAELRCERLPIGFGLFDMQGNVSEWCNDVWEREFPAAETLHDPLGPVQGRNRVVRGGSFRGGETALRFGYRTYGNRTTRSGDVGFRVARTLPVK